MTFRPALWLSVFTMAGLIILINLGLWQVRRLEWKQALIETVEARTSGAPVSLDEALALAAAGEDISYLPVAVSGAFRHAEEMPLFRTYEGAPGYHIVTPLELSDSRAVLINRGFVPQALKESASRPDSLVAGAQEIVGLALPAEEVPAIARPFRPSNQPDENQWYVRDIEAMSLAVGVPPLPFVIVADADGPGGVPAGGVAPVSFRNNHLDYALTWFGLAATLIGVYIAYHFRTGRFSLRRGAA